VLLSYHELRRRKDVIRTASKSLKLGQERAARALHVLISEGKIATPDVYATMKRREKLLRELPQNP
jgi:hypothetical protein